MPKTNKHNQEHRVHSRWDLLMVLKIDESRQVTMPSHAIELKVAPKAAETKAVKTSEQ